MFEKNKNHIRSLLSSEMNLNTSWYDYIVYINNNVLPVLHEIQDIIEPFCINTAIHRTPSTASLIFSTKLFSSNILIIEVSSDCKQINFDLSSGDSLVSNRNFTINDPTKNDQPIVWAVLTEFLQSRLDYLTNILINDPEIQSLELIDFIQNNADDDSLDDDSLDDDSLDDDSLDDDSLDDDSLDDHI